MKYLINTLFLSFILMSFNIFYTFAQNDNTLNISRKWKIDIIYSDSVQIVDTNIRHLRYHFIPNGTFVMEDIFENKSLAGNWQWRNESEFLIYKEDKEIQKGKVVYLDHNHLIFTYIGKYTNRNKEVLIEYRMIPDF